jgi:two-component system KDP operon response regulator KdpE
VATVLAVDGMEVCHRIRQWSDVPIIVLSADGTEDRKIASLDGGADDYMTKPFGMGELEARIRVALRHRASEGNEEEVKSIAVGPLELDLVHHEARVDARPVDLTTREFTLLVFLARHAGKICTHRMILEHVWGPHYGTETQYLRVYVYRLRRKLGDEKGELVRTHPGVGYQLVDEHAV